MALVFKKNIKKKWIQNIFIFWKFFTKLVFILASSVVVYETLNEFRKKKICCVVIMCLSRWHTLLKMFSFCENEKTCVNRRKQRWFFFIASSSDCCCVILKGIVLFPILQPTTDAEERVETQYCMYYLNICQNNYKRWQMKIN